MTEPAPPPPFALYDLACRLLELVSDGLTRRAVTLPKRRYIAQGSQVAYDDEQLTVTPQSITPGQPTRPELLQQVAGEFQSARFLVCIVRNVPVGSNDGSPPSVRELNASARASAADTAALYDVLVNVRDTGALAGPGAPVALIDCHQEGPAGGVVATIGTIEVGVF